MLILDDKGIIAFDGHPNSRDLSNDIDNLLNGQLLAGEGCAGLVMP
jgi:hypothetical protein